LGTYFLFGSGKGQIAHIDRRHMLVSLCWSKTPTAPGQPGTVALVQTIRRDPEIRAFGCCSLLII
ncbi:MAG TPA: hypothetical protein VJS89_05590, partial [Gammaproteobacteria bacterium]|nr:hypothetical protein [Gammaproteobacteria bacterium]